MIHRAPATPELTTAFRSVACLFGSRFGSWIWTVQPLAYACTPSDSCFIAGIDSASGEKTRVCGSFAEVAPEVVLPPEAVLPELDEELHAASSNPAAAAATAIEARLRRP